MAPECVHVIDHFLPGHIEDEIESRLLNWQNRFDWYYYANTNYPDNQTRVDDAPQFIHGFMRADGEASCFSSIPLDIVSHFGVSQSQILRAKANLLMRESTPHIHPRHRDDSAPHYVFIYYVIDSDGDTCLFEGHDIVHRITPGKGRGVLFDGRYMHASSAPVDHPIRVVINFNLSPDIDVSRFSGPQEI